MKLIATPVSDAHEPGPSDQKDDSADPLARFRSWRGFLFAAVAVNLLFTYGMLHNTVGSNHAIWFKVLVWLPFNAISTALYFAFMVKLGKASATNNQTGGLGYVLLSAFMIGANWITLIVA